MVPARKIRSACLRFLPAPLGAWVVQICCWCSFRTAPEYAEPTLPVRILTGGPRASPTQFRKVFLRTAGEGLKVNRPKAERSHPGVCPSRGPVWDRPLREKCSRLPVRRRGGYQPPASLPPLRGKVPSTCEADEGGLRYGRDPSAGRPVSGPYAKNAPASLFAVGAAPCGRPNLIRHGLWPCHLPLKGKARVRITPPTQSPTEWVCVGEEEQGSGRSFRRQAETETS